VRCSSTLDGSGWSRPCPGHFTLGKKIWYPMYRRLGWSKVPSVQMRKITPPTRIHCTGHSAHSELLHQLCYPGPFCTKVLGTNFNSYVFIKFMTEYVMQKIEKLLLVKVFKSVSK